MVTFLKMSCHHFIKKNEQYIENISLYYPSFLHNVTSCQRNKRAKSLSACDKAFEPSALVSEW